MWAVELPGTVSTSSGDSRAVSSSKARPVFISRLLCHFRILVVKARFRLSNAFLDSHILWWCRRGALFQPGYPSTEVGYKSQVLVAVKVGP